MIKKELVAEVAYRTGIAQYEAKQVIDSVIEIIVEANGRGEEVNLRGLGTFSMVLRKGKPVRDLINNKPMYMEDTWKPKFIPSKQLEKEVSKLKA